MLPQKWHTYGSVMGYRYVAKIDPIWFLASWTSRASRVCGLKPSSSRGIGPGLSCEHDAKAPQGNLGHLGTHHFVRQFPCHPGKCIYYVIQQLWNIHINIGYITQLYMSMVLSSKSLQDVHASCHFARLFSKMKSLHLFAALRWWPTRSQWRARYF